MNAQDIGFYEDEFNPDTGEIIEHETTALTASKTETVMTDSAPQLIHPTNMPNLDEMDEGFTLAAKYVEFLNVGETQRGVFLGFSNMRNQKGESIPLANFQNKDGVWVNAGANLVYQLRDRGIPYGTPLQVKYNGKVKTKSGNEVKSFEIRILNHKPTPQPQTLVSTARAETVDERAAAAKAARAEQPKQEWTEELREAYADGLGAEDKNLPQMKLQAGGVPIPSHQTSGKRVSLISPVQKTKLAELYQTLHGTNETDTIDGLNALFIAEYRRDMKDATYEQGARMTGKLLAELRHRPQEQTAAA